MPRVKCPHCGAGNQDATDADTCWQCSNVLGAPVARAEGAARPLPNTMSGPTQQLNMDMLRDMKRDLENNAQPQYQPQQQIPRQGVNPLIIVLATLLGVVILALIYALTRR